MNAPAHRKRSEDGTGPRRVSATRIAVTIGAVAAVTGITAGVALAVDHRGATAHTRSLLGLRSGSESAATRAAGVTTTTTTPVPLSVMAVTPAKAATGITTGSVVSITFSVAPSTSSPTPTLSPTVAGHWDRAGRTWTFHPAAGFIPGTREMVAVPKATVAEEDGRTIRLATTYTSTFTVGAGSTLRLQEMLAELHYLPLTFTRSVAPSAPTSAPASTVKVRSTRLHAASVHGAGGVRATTSAPTTSAPTTSAPTTSTTVAATTTTAATVTAPTTSPTTAAPTSTTASSSTTTRQAETTAVVLTGIAAEPTVAAEVPRAAVKGRFSWTYGNIPASLASDWSEGRADLMTKGAVMAFEADHGLGVDGVAGPEVWGALVKAVAARQTDPRAYNYIEVTESLPETLSVWQDGRSGVYTSPANTGAEGAATQLGTFPVYLRYTSHAMVGTNPDGSKYNDPDIQWIAYFNGGDAVHGYVRSSYGFPQSNGCVELPIANAGAVFNSGEDWYGTLVNIT